VGWDQGQREREPSEREIVLEESLEREREIVLEESLEREREGEGEIRHRD